MYEIRQVSMTTGTEATAPFEAAENCSQTFERIIQSDLNSKIPFFLNFMLITITSPLSVFRFASPTPPPTESK